MTVDMILFFVLALISVVSAVCMLLSRNAVYSALFLIINFSTIALFYLMLGAPFLAMAQVTVYAGAIMVLFLFVIMLLNLPREDVPWAPRDIRRIVLAASLSLVLLVELALVIGLRTAPAKEPALSVGFGTTEMVGRLLFTKFLFPFEITSIILLVAIVGAMVLAQKHFR